MNQNSDDDIETVSDIIGEEESHVLLGSEDDTGKKVFLKKFENFVIGKGICEKTLRKKTIWTRELAVKCISFQKMRSLNF